MMVSLSVTDRRAREIGVFKAVSFSDHEKLPFNYSRIFL